MYVCIYISPIAFPVLYVINYWLNVILRSQVENIAGICDSIIIHDVLHKQKVYLDAFAEGLEVFHLKTAINTFPKLFKELFVASDACTPSDVIAILHFDEDLGPEKKRVERYMEEYYTTTQRERYKLNYVIHFTPICA